MTWRPFFAPRDLSDPRTQRWPEDEIPGVESATRERQFSGEEHKPEDDGRHTRTAIGEAHVLDLVEDESFSKPHAVWLNTEVSDFDGLVLALGDTRAAAVGDAIDLLERTLTALRGQR